MARLATGSGNVPPPATLSRITHSDMLSISRCPSVSSIPPRLTPARLAWLALVALVGPTLLAAETTAPDNTAPGASAPSAIPAPAARTSFGQDHKHVRPPEPPAETEAEADPAAGEDDGPPRFPPRDATGQQSYPYLQLNGLIEAGWVYTNPYAGSSKDEGIISTLDLVMTFQPHPWVKVQASGLYQDNGRAPLELDVAQLRVGPPEGTWFVDGGQFYLPFGRYDSSMVSDPLTLELGETREIGGGLGFALDPFFGAAYAFEGEQHEGGGQSSNAWGLEVGFAGQVGAHSLTLALGYLSDLGDSDRLREVVEDGDRVGGLAASLLFEAGSWTLIGEYVTATERFNLGAGEALAEQQPSAWMLEAGYGFDLFRKPAQIALGYQGSAEALALELPAARWLATFNLAIYDYTTVQLEYVHDQDYGASEGGTGDSGNGFTAQVAIAF
ncbi:MAG: LbtU family siderophore porin [Gammaproteobacteria bacterium]|nr:MAG: LbtU family siderophore porin [Gammaproteobacteria bacterium]